MRVCLCEKRKREKREKNKKHVRSRLTGQPEMSVTSIAMTLTAAKKIQADI